MSKKNTFGSALGNVWGTVGSLASATSTLAGAVDHTAKAAIPVAETQEMKAQSYKRKETLNTAKEELLFMRELEEELAEHGLTMDQLTNN
jgi:hypothetical protein